MEREAPQRRQDRVVTVVAVITASVAERVLWARHCCYECFLGLVRRPVGSQLFAEGDTEGKRLA